MKIERIAFEQLYPTGAYSNQRLRVEIALQEEDFFMRVPVGDMSAVTSIPNPEEVIQNAFETAKKIVNDTFVKMNPHITWSEQKEVSQPSVTENRIQTIINDLNACTSIDEKNNRGVQTGLIAFEEAANQNEEIKKAYNTKMNELNGNI